ncbi:hypothetical protein O6H91_21G009700 [Diphasiastrum complanatum]|uniref:Uncharacterized protein n=1 Tax=Diphasiastrum complanatum TaxID=34168 RepID=A0ACC2AHN3_DIPCM|nr:hypothetical protein O6H91_21G009700 [Diphasiastrum complanatum]
MDKLMNFLNVTMRFVTWPSFEKIVLPFEWDNSAEGSEVNKSWCKHWLGQIQLGREHILFMAWNAKDPLSVIRQDHFPFSFCETCDMAICLRHVVRSLCLNIVRRILF